MWDCTQSQALRQTHLLLSGHGYILGGREGRRGGEGRGGEGREGQRGREGRRRERRDNKYEGEGKKGGGEGGEGREGGAMAQAVRTGEGPTAKRADKEQLKETKRGEDPYVP